MLFEVNWRVRAAALKVSIPYILESQGKEGRSIAYRFIAIKMLLLADLNYLNQPQVLPGPNMSFPYSLLNRYIDDYLTAVKPHNLSAWQMDRHELNYVSGTGEKTTRRLISMQAQIMEWPRENTKLFCVLSL